MTDRLAYTIPEAAQATGMSARHIDRCVKAGELPSKLSRTKRVILADDLRDWLRNLPNG